MKRLAHKKILNQLTIEVLQKNKTILSAGMYEEHRKLSFVLHVSCVKTLSGYNYVTFIFIYTR